MLKRRIIPCLDIKDGRTVKGVNFIDIKDAGDPIELAKKYVKDGADELVFLDITASNEKRKTLIDLVNKIAREINIPFTVGGGINSVEDAKRLINAGADKISINTSAVKNKNIIKELANELGSQCVVVAIDTQKIENQDMVFINGGSVPTNLKTIDWVKEVSRLGAGEILLTSMNRDGTKIGFDIDLLSEISRSTNLPIIASGGAGCIVDFKELFENTPITGALAASIFHYDEVSIKELKEFLKEENIAIR